jgi:hypothetical protein
MEQKLKKEPTAQEKRNGCIVLIVLGIILSVTVYKCGGCGSPETSTTETKLKTHEERIKDGFSAWDGSHIKLVRLMKENMNDASSFEHVETKYWDRDSFIVVSMKYRGTNAFGAKVLGQVMAKCDTLGNVMKIMSQE